MPFPIGRVQVVMTGFAGAPGLMQFYFTGASSITFTPSDGSSAIAAVHTFLASSAGAISNTVAMQVQPTLEVIEATNGALLGVVASTPVAAVGGAASGDVHTATGPLVQWITSDVVDRRLVRGRTFMTPSGDVAMTSLGTVEPTLVTTIEAAGAAMIASGPVKFVIWHRPHPYKTGSNGSHHDVVAATVPVKVAVLRSRRD